MSYSLVKEHKNSFELKHPDGSNFHVAKYGLDKKMHESIKALKMADGGEVPGEEGGDEEAPAPEMEQSAEDQPQEPAQEEPQTPVVADNSVSQGLTEQLGSLNGEQKQSEGLQTTAQMEQANTKPQGREYGPKLPPPPEKSGSILNQFQQAYGEQAQGIKQKSEAQAQGLNAQANYLERNAIEQKKAMDAHNELISKNVSRRAELEKAIADQKINPVGMFSNKTTAQQIGTALAVALGGIGSGLSGKPNMALGIINDQIDRDIKAQEQELGKKQNLLSQNLREYGDLNSAKQATRLDMQAATQGHLQALAARSGSAQAQAEAHILGGQLKTQQLSQEGPLAMQQMGLDAMRSMQNGGPVNRQALEMLPQYKGKTVALPDGKVGVAATPEGAKKVTEVQIAADDLKETLKRMADFEKTQKVGGTMGAHVPFVGDVGSSNYHLAKALQAEAFAKINHLAGINRMSDVDLQEVLMKQIPDPGSMNGEAVRSRIDEMTKNIDSKLSAYYKNNLLNYKSPEPIKKKEGPPVLGAR